MKKPLRFLKSVAATALVCVVVLFLTWYIKDWVLFRALTRPEQPKPSAQAEQLPTEIRFSWWGGEARNEATLRALDLFMKEHPDIRVIPDPQDYDGYHDRLLVSLSSGEAADLFQYNPENISALAPREYAEPLEGYVRDGKLDIAGIPAENLVDGKYQGRLYGVPMSIQSFCIIYNKTLFDEAGVAYPKDDWSWQDFEDCLRQLKDGLPEGVYPSTDLRTADLVTLLMVHQQGGAYLTWQGQPNFDRAIAQPLQMMQNLMQDGLIPPATVTATPGDMLLSQRRVAMTATYNAMAGTLQGSAPAGDVFALAPIPGSVGGSWLGNYIKGELLFVVNAQSERKKEAIALLNAFINDQDMNEELRFMRGIPPNARIVDMLRQNLKGIERDVLRIQQLAEQSLDTPEPRFFSAWSPLVEIIESETLRYSVGLETLEGTIARMRQRVARLMLTPETQDAPPAEKGSGTEWPGNTRRSSGETGTSSTSPPG